MTTTIANPLTVNADGTFEFFVPDGAAIRIRESAAGAVTRDIDNIVVPIIPVRLTNRSGGTLLEGAVGIQDIDNNSSLTTTTATAATRAVFVQTSASVSNLGTGYYAHYGERNVLVQGAVTRGNYLTTGSTAGRAVDAGSTPVSGGFGVALTNFAGPGAGSVRAALFGPAPPGTPGAAGPAGAAGPTGPAGAAFSGGALPPFPLNPVNAMLPNTNFPVLKKTVSASQFGYTLVFDGGTQQSASWDMMIPRDVTISSLSLDIASRTDTATGGTVGWLCYIKSSGNNELWDQIGTSQTTVTATTVNTNVGRVLIQQATPSTTGLSAGELWTINIARHVALDTLAADVHFMGAALRIL